MSEDDPRVLSSGCVPGFSGKQLPQTRPKTTLNLRPCLPETWVCHGSALHKMASFCTLVVNIVKRFGGLRPPNPLLSRGIAT